MFLFYFYKELLFFKYNSLKIFITRFNNNNKKI